MKDFRFLRTGVNSALFRQKTCLCRTIPVRFIPYPFGLRGHTSPGCGGPVIVVVQVRSLISTGADGALVGIGAVVLDGARVGEGALVGAGALVAPGVRIEPGGLALGVPARVVRSVTDEERELQRRRTLDYVATARAHAREDAGSPGVVDRKV